MQPLPSLIASSLDQARGYLDGVARDAADLFSVQVSLDPRFGTTLPRSQVREMLRQHAGIDPGFNIGADAFSSMIGLALAAPPEAIVPPRLIARFVQQAARRNRHHRYSYFVDMPEFPADTDCTAVAAGALYEHGRLTLPQLEGSCTELVRAVTPQAHNAENQGQVHDDELHPDVVMVYWDDDGDPHALRRGKKHDAVVCANVLYTLSLARASGAEQDGTAVIDATAAYVGAHLESQRYLSGTRYYPAAEAFMFAVSRLCGRFDSHARTLGDMVRREVTSTRQATAGNPLSLAMSIIAADNVGLGGTQQDHKEMLVRGQQRDGSWSAAPYYRMGRFAVYFGSPLITTLFAVRALQGSATRRRHESPR